MALGHGGRAVRVEREGVAVDHALQVGADVAGVLRRLRPGGIQRGIVHGFERQQFVALRHVGTGRGGEVQHAARVRREQHMLHLHGFEHGQLGARRHHVALGHGVLHQARGHGGAHGMRVGVLGGHFWF